MNPATYIYVHSYVHSSLMYRNTMQKPILGFCRYQSLSAARIRQFATLFFVFVNIARAQGVNEATNSSSISAINSTVNGLSYCPVPSGYRVQGWVSQANVRGTIDIIWTSLATIFISSYVILCLNVPSEGEKWQSIAYRRVLWMGVSIAGPEFVLSAAAGQRAEARRSVEDFKSIGYETWTMKHAFFANMGGIEIKPPDFVPFRVNAKQLHFLIAQGYLPYPNVSLKEIWDKSKQDTMAKIITCVQITYLILQCIGRALQDLEITTLELFALAIVVCSIATSWCWLHKPADVKFPIRIDMNTHITRILREGGPAAARPYRQTPLDFIDDLCPSWSLNVQTFMHMPLGPFERPIPRFGNDRLPHLELRENLLLFVATLTYASVHVCAWNWTFPTRIENILWRIASMILLCSTITFWMFEGIAIWYRRGGEKFLYKVLNMMDRLEDIEKLRIERAANPRPLPLKVEFWSIFPLAVIYAIARTYLLAEAFGGLRNLEASAFVNVNWSIYIPHV